MPVWRVSLYCYQWCPTIALLLWYVLNTHDDNEVNPQHIYSWLTFSRCYVFDLRDVKYLKMSQTKGRVHCEITMVTGGRFYSGILLTVTFSSAYDEVSWLCFTVSSQLPWWSLVVLCSMLLMSLLHRCLVLKVDIQYVSFIRKDLTLFNCSWSPSTLSRIHWSIPVYSLGSAALECSTWFRSMWPEQDWSETVEGEDDEGDDDEGQFKFTEW